MKRMLTLATLATALLTTCGEPTPQHPNNTFTIRGFDTVRRVQLPGSSYAYVLRDAVGGTCLLMTTVYGGTAIQIVPDSMCGT